MTEIVEPVMSPSTHEEEEYHLEEEAGDYFEPAQSARTDETARHEVSATPTPSPGPTLRIIRGEKTGTLFPVQKEMTIGRASNNGIVLKEPKISRQHAVIRKKGNRYAIEDLQSSNGLYVNGARVIEHFLHDGDEVQIGDFVLKFSNTSA